MVGEGGGLYQSVKRGRFSRSLSNPGGRLENDALAAVPVASFGDEYRISGPTVPGLRAQIRHLDWYLSEDLLEL